MNTQENIDKVMQATAENTERAILFRLQELVRKGLVVENGEFILKENNKTMERGE